MMNVQWLSRTNILPYFHTNKWACHSFMDTLEDMEFLVRDKGQLSTHSRSTSQSISIYTVPKAPIPTSLCEQEQMTCTHNALHYRKGTLSFGNRNLLEWVVSIPVLCSKRRYYHYCTGQVACLFTDSERDTISKTVSSPALSLEWNNILSSKAASTQRSLKR